MKPTIIDRIVIECDEALAEYDEERTRNEQERAEQMRLRAAARAQHPSAALRMSDRFKVWDT